MSPEENSFLHAVAAAFSSADRARAEALGARLLEAPTPFSAEFSDNVLHRLRQKRHYQLLQLFAERLLETAEDDPRTWHHYALALLETGRISAAARVADATLSRTTEPKLRAELLGLTGRVHKERFLSSVSQDRDRGKVELQKSLDAYTQGYKTLPACDPDVLYHAINIVALLKRAERDSLPINNEHGTSADKVATEALNAVEKCKWPGDWEMAVAAEASLALGQPVDEVIGWLKQYVVRRDVDAFELASTLRQFTEVWQLDEPDGGKYAPAVALLRKHLLEVQGGTVDLSSSEIVQTIAGTQQLGDRDGVRTYEWFRTGLERSKAVGLITTPHYHGSGFLVNASDLHPRWAREPVFVTCSHITLDDDPAAMTVRFEALGIESKGAQRIWSRPHQALDVAILRLQNPPAAPTCCPVSRNPSAVRSSSRVYVIGHPAAGDLSFSLFNSEVVHVGHQLLHYDAFTRPGNSGSPVFDDHWNVIGIHRGKSWGHLPDGTPFESNDAVIIGAVREGAIMEQDVMEPLPRGGG